MFTKNRLNELARGAFLLGVTSLVLCFVLAIVGIFIPKNVPVSMVIFSLFTATFVLIFTGVIIQYFITKPDKQVVRQTKTLEAYAADPTAKPLDSEEMKTWAAIVKELN